jgi:hypothetical protein
VQQGTEPAGHVPHGHAPPAQSASEINTVQSHRQVTVLVFGSHGVLVPGTTQFDTWHELFAPTQHDWLQALPGLLWQQWPEMQSGFLPQPVQPVGI